MQKLVSDMVMLNYVAEGMKKLNVIRERAGIAPVLTAWAKAKEPLTDYSSVGPDGRLMQIVRQERMIELYMETHNFWDLRRWKLGKNTLVYIRED